MKYISSEDLIKGISGAKILLVNEIEFIQIKKITGLTERDILDYGLMLAHTLGSQGSILQIGDQQVRISAVPPNNYLDPTGAGDAYCAGLVKAFIENQRLDIKGKFASLTATYAIESIGALNHKFTLLEFMERYKLVFEEEQRNQ